jgi:hypothetical protein
MESHKNEENIDTKNTYSWVKYLMYIIAIAGFVIAIVAIFKAYDNVSIITDTDVKTVFSRTGDIIAVNGDYSADQVTSAVDQSSLTSKGDLFAATSKEKVGVLTAGADGFVLTSDSSKPTGLKWGEVEIFNKAMLNPLFRYIASANYTANGPTGGDTVAYNLTYSPVSKIAITSGVIGSISCTSVDGIVWDKQTLLKNVTIEYSPDLNLFSAIEINGIIIQTSVDGITWDAGSSADKGFFTSDNPVQLKWFSEFGKFFTGSKDEDNRIYTSTDGKVYNLIKSSRRANDFATNGSIIVAVGEDGPQYSEDGGVSWSNSINSTVINCVAYSPTTGLFVSGQRGEGSESEIWHSTDGKTWDLSGGTNFTSAIRCITWVQDLQMFVLGADSGMWISNDGFYFLNVYIPVQTDLQRSVSGVHFIEEWGMLFGLAIGRLIVSTPKLFIF